MTARPPAYRFGRILLLGSLADALAPIRASLAEHLEPAGIDVIDEAANLARQLAKREHVLLILDSSQTPEIDLAAVDTARSTHPSIAVLLLVSGQHEATTLDLAHRGIDGVVVRSTTATSGDEHAVAAAACYAVGNARMREDRRHAVEMLVRSEAELRRLAAARERTQETLRRALSREIHDDLGQLLAGLGLEIGLLDGQLKREHPEAANAVRRLQVTVDDAVDRVRRIATSLRPSVLDDLGLQDAADWLLRDICSKAGLGHTLEIESDFDLADEALETALFRILQEALTNTVRHARAQNVTLRFRQPEDGWLCVDLWDDGIGITVPGPAHAGLGLVSMRERADGIGAVLDIHRGARGGTFLHLRVPLSELP